MEVNYDPAGFLREIPLAPHQLVERSTPQEGLFVLAHLGVPRIEAASWRLEVGGLVERPRGFTFAEILQLPMRRVESFHQCAGFPRRSDIATRRVANVTWGGADLRELLEGLGVAREARYLLAQGFDHGAYDGLPPADYVKDMPLERLDEGGVLLAYEVNDQPLAPKHGFPLRLVIPGYYGTNAVKWLRRLELSAQRADGVFTTELYNDPVAPAAPGEVATTRPVWKAGPEAIIVAPAHRSKLDAAPTQVSGWAWSSAGVARVEVSVDAGESWLPAQLEPRAQWSWQAFSAPWTPLGGGTHRVMARATDTLGSTQPMERARNCVHAVSVDVAAR